MKARTPKHQPYGRHLPLTSLQVLSADQLQMGMTRLLVATDDLLLDCPDAVRLLSLFLGRAIVDEILPPSFLTQVGQPRDTTGLPLRATDLPRLSATT